MRRTSGSGSPHRSANSSYVAASFPSGKLDAILNRQIACVFANSVA